MSNNKKDTTVGVLGRPMLWEVCRNTEPEKMDTMKMEQLF